MDDSFYKRLVITQSRTFEDPNYLNTIGSKVVIKPLSEAWELCVKKDLLLQRTMVIPTQQASSSQDVAADLLSGAIPESVDANAAGDLPSGEMPDAEEAEDLKTYHQVRDQRLKQRKKMWTCKNLKKTTRRRNSTRRANGGAWLRTRRR